MINIYELKKNYVDNNPDGHFFDADIMSAYGESIDSMRVTGKGVIKTRCGDMICYEVGAQSKDFTGYHERRYYFDCDTYEMVNLVTA